MERIILFDGVCNLCTGSVQFVIKHDPEGKFKFASLQSSYGQALMAREGIPTEELSSFILVEDGRVYRRSTAALRVAKQLPGAWPLLYAFSAVPPFIRNAVYDFIAANRYRWFGKQESCMVPTPELRGKFLG